MPKVRMLLAAAVCAATTFAMVGPSHAWSVLGPYSSGAPTTATHCSWQPITIAGQLNLRNTCTGQIIPALR